MCHSIQVEYGTRVAAFAEKTNMVPFFDNDEKMKKLILKNQKLFSYLFSNSGDV